MKGAQSATVFQTEEAADTACVEIDPENCLGLKVEAGDALYRCTA